MNFTFSLPVWGSWHTWLYLRDGLKSHANAGLEGKYIIHTNRKDILEPYVQNMLTKCEVEYRELHRDHNNQSYFQFSRYQQEVFEESEACIFLQPDTVMRYNTFTSVKKAIEKGYKMVMTAGINALHDEPIPQDDRLNLWAMEHLIPELRGNLWEPGKESIFPLSTLYFRDGENFWCHAFHHHPFCIVNDRRMEFKHSTIDWLVPSFFSKEETKVLSGHEGLMVESSPEPKFKNHPRFVANNATDIALSVRDKIMTNHLNLFSQPIAIVGSPTAKYDKLIADILEILETPLFASNRLTK